MKFPITRESLQAFDYVKEQEEVMEEEFKGRIAKIIYELCGEFKLNMQSNSKEKRFVWRKVNLLAEAYTYIIWETKNERRKHLRRGSEEYLPQFIDKLKEVFIGCDIIVDPLKTYIIIDWS